MVSPVQPSILYDHEWFLNFPGAQEVGGSCGPFYVLHFGNLLLNSVTDDPLPPQSFTTSLSLDSLFYPCCPCQVTWLSFLTGLAFAQWLTRSRVFFWSQFQLSFHLHRTCERRCPSYLAPPLPHACCVQRWCACVTGYAHFWYVVSFAMLLHQPGDPLPFPPDASMFHWTLYVLLLLILPPNPMPIPQL